MHSVVVIPSHPRAHLFRSHGLPLVLNVVSPLASPWLARRSSLTQAISPRLLSLRLTRNHDNKMDEMDRMRKHRQMT